MSGRIISPPIRAGKDYIYVVELLRALVDATGAENGLQLEMHRRPVHPIELVQFPDRSAPSPSTCGYFRFLAGADIVEYQLVLRDDIDLDLKETVIAPSLPVPNFREFGCTLSEGHTLNIFEGAVAVALAFLKWKYVGSRWYLANLSFDHVPPDSEAIDLELTNRIGSRFCRLSVSSGSEKLGHLLFALAEA